MQSAVLLSFTNNKHMLLTFEIKATKNGPIFHVIPMSFSRNLLLVLFSFCFVIQKQIKEKIIESLRYISKYHYNQSYTYEHFCFFVNEKHIYLKQFILQLHSQLFCVIVCSLLPLKFLACNSKCISVIYSISFDKKLKMLIS